MENRSHKLFHRYQRYPGQKGGSTGYDGCKKVNASNLSALVDWNGLQLACIVSPTNVHDSRLYEPTLEAFAIPDVQDQQSIISADPAYDSREIHQYNPKKRIKQHPGQPEIPDTPKTMKAILVRSGT